MNGYIWSNYTPDKQFHINGQNCSVLESVSPYENAPNEAEVNVTGRFSSVFTDDVLQELQEQDTTGALSNTVIHFLAQTDLLYGRLAVSWAADVILDEIIAGRYGTEVAERMTDLSLDDRELFLHYLKMYHQSCERVQLFQTVFFELFGTLQNRYGNRQNWKANPAGHSAEIYHRLSDDVWFCFCAIEWSAYQENRFELTKILFADFSKDIRPVWGTFCFGIIGCEHTKQAAVPIIDRIQIL